MPSSESSIQSRDRDERDDSGVKLSPARRASVFDVSDDESDGQLGRRGSPGPDGSDSDVAEGARRARKQGSSRSGSDVEEDRRSRLSGDQSGSEDARRVTGDGDSASPRSPRASRTGESHHRSLVDMSVPDERLTLLQIPSSLDVPLGPSNPGTDSFPPDALSSVMFRLKPGLSRASIETAVANHGPIAAMPVIAESNTRLVSWSDGSRTLMVGNEHYAVTEERVQPNNLYVFRRGEDVQAFHGEVGKSLGVQPTTVTRKRNSAMVALAPDVKKKQRQMQFCLDGGAELEELEKKKQYLQKERERAKLENKRRRMGERTIRPEARLTRSALEDDEDSEDDEDDEVDAYDPAPPRDREAERRERESHRREQERVQRRREEEREARLRESKRAAAADERVDVVRRRKLGSRRVLDSDEDEEEDDE